MEEQFSSNQLAKQYSQNLTDQLRIQSLISQAICQHSHQSAYLICSSPSCNQNAIICSSQDCQCHKLHNKCITKLISPILYTIYSKLYKYKSNLPVQHQQMKIQLSSLTSVINDMIDHLSQLRDSLNNYLESYPLNQIQFTFKTAFQTSATQKITGLLPHLIAKNYLPANHKLNMELISQALTISMLQFKKMLSTKLSGFKYYTSDIKMATQGFIYKAFTSSSKKKATDKIFLKAIEEETEILNCKEILYKQSNLKEVPLVFNLLKNLKLLNMNRNPLKKIQNVSNLKLLQRLQISDNQLQSMKGMKNLKSLNYLKLSINKINQIEPYHFKKLTFLDLSQNKISSMQNVSNFISLENLSLDNNNIIILEGLIKLKQLKVLKLDNNPLQTIQSLKSQTKLQILNLSENNFGPNQQTLLQLRYCKSLKRLDLYKGKVRDISGQVCKTIQNILKQLKENKCSIIISNKYKVQGQFQRMAWTNLGYNRTRNQQSGYKAQQAFL